MEKVLSINTGFICFIDLLDFHLELERANESEFLPCAFPKWKAETFGFAMHSPLKSFIAGMLECLLGLRRILGEIRFSKRLLPRKERPEAAKQIKRQKINAMSPADIR